MDYGFAPGTTPQDGRARNMFVRRGNTTLITAARNRNTVKGFISHLQNTAAITKPIDDLLIGTHANSNGQLAIPLFPNQRVATSYELVEDTITDTTKSIAIPDALIGHTPGNPISKHFHIKGCNIGKVPPFLQKFKEALGAVKVTAPLHFDCLADLSTHGTWEFMQYEFRMVRKAAFANRNDYITALNTAGFTFYNGDPILKKDWEALVPQNISKTSATAVRLPLGTTINKRTTIPFEDEFRYRKSVYTYTVNFPNAGSVPKNKPAQLAALSTSLDNHKYRSTDTVGGFDPAHPYPEYQRWGYSSKQDFMDEHEWSFSISGNRLVCNGLFHDYSLLTTITDRTAATMGNLIFNFYPIASTGLAAIITGLQVTDTKFFATA